MQQPNRWTPRKTAYTVLGAGIFLLGLSALGQIHLTTKSHDATSLTVVGMTSKQTSSPAPAQQPPVDQGHSGSAPAKAPDASHQTQQAQTVAPSKPTYSVATYTVKSGDTLWDIAGAYHTDVDSILALNPDISESALQPGDKLTVPNFAGAVYVVQTGDTLSDVAAMYGMKIDEIVADNQLPSSDAITIGQKLLLPGARPPVTVTASRGGGHTATARVSVGLIWPLQGPITSPYGPRWGSFHTGIDIGVGEGTPVHAAAAGTVIEASWDGGYGNCIIVEHANGTRTRYGHLSRYKVSVGDTVDQGQVIALSGNTGHSTGPHLHFEVIIGGHTQDPMGYLP